MSPLPARASGPNSHLQTRIVDRQGVMAEDHDRAIRPDGQLVQPLRLVGIDLAIDPAGPGGVEHGQRHAIEVDGLARRDGRYPARVGPVVVVAPGHDQAITEGTAVDPLKLPVLVGRPGRGEVAFYHHGVGDEGGDLRGGGAVHDVRIGIGVGPGGENRAQRHAGKVTAAGLAEVHVVDGGHRRQPLTRRAGQGADRDRPGGLLAVRFEAFEPTDRPAIEHHGLIVGDGRHFRRHDSFSAARRAEPARAAHATRRLRTGPPPAGESPGAGTGGRGWSDDHRAGPGHLDGGHDGGQLLGAGVGPESGHSGTLPCLRLGSSSRLDRNKSRLRDSTRRVSAGSMTSST